MSNKKNNSIVDEFHKNKRLIKKLKFKKIDKDFLWKCFIVSFKKTFKIKRELEQNLKFGLKIGGIHSNYIIETFDELKYILQINWNHGDDKYWMKFQIKKSIFNKLFIKVTEHIYRSTPFWGLQDTAGMMILKKSFKKEMKNFRNSINIVIENNGSIPEQ